MAPGDDGTGTQVWEGPIGPELPPPPAGWSSSETPTWARPERPPRAADPAPGRLLLLAVLAAAGLEVGLRGGAANLLVALGLGLVVVALLADGRLVRRPARVTVALALVPIAFLVLRASPWLAGTNVAAACALVAVALACSRSGSPLDLSPGQLLARLAGVAPAAATGAAAVRPALPTISATSSQRAARSVLAAMLCAPVLLLLVALLSAADPVFAGILTPSIDAGPTVLHVLGIATIALLVLGVVGGATADPTESTRPGTVGAGETATVLGLVALVLVAFVAAQLLALTDAGDRLVRDAGLTPAEYARSGFFQLCWATGLVLGLLAAVRALAAPHVQRAPIVRALSTAVPLLATGLVVVSIRRLALYDQAFGLTMLRLWVVGAAVWMGFVLLCLAARNAGLGTRRGWVLGAAGIAALVLLLGANVADPEARIVRHNLDRADRGAELDVAYLATLSADATPVLADAALQDPVRLASLLDALRCDEARPSGVHQLNVAVQRADDRRDAACDLLVRG